MFSLYEKRWQEMADVYRKAVEEAKKGKTAHRFCSDYNDSLRRGILQRVNDLTKSSSVAAGEKPSNPKDAVGVKKPPMSCVPLPVLMEVGVAMLEGARKYGRHNYREAHVRASVYFDAAMRHLFQWYEGEDIDPDSALSHITKAISSLVVLRDGMIQDKWVDDRPPKTKDGWMRDLDNTIQQIFEKYPEAKDAFTEK